MRSAMLVVLFGMIGMASAQDGLDLPEVRYDIKYNKESYPQGTPQETIKSIVLAIDRGRFDYMVAQLIDPDIVDRRVKQTKTTFPMVVQDVQTRFGDDPESLKQLKKFATEGEFTENGDAATATLKDVKGRAVSFKKIGTRWFMMNQRADVKSPAPAPAEEKKDQ